MTRSMPIAEIPLFVQSLEHIIGFIIVMVILAALWLITAGIGRVAQRVAGPAPSPKAAPPAQGGLIEPDEEEVAAIGATVALLMGRPSRVVSIQPVAKDWSREGRREIFASHRIR